MVPRLFGPVALLLLTTGPALAQLNKSFAYPQGLGTSFIFSSSLPARFSQYTALSTVPAQCLAYSSQTHSEDGSLFCDPSTGGVMQAMNLSVQDCTAPVNSQETQAGFQVGQVENAMQWTVCRCSDAPNTFESLAQQFSRLPVNLRDYVRYLVAFSGEESAFSESGDMVLFGDETTEQGMTVLIHESHHDIDQGTSASSAWTDAIASDSCVPDPYAGTNAIEDFAQVGVVHLYLDIFGTPPGNVDISCMRNQLSVFDSNARLNANAMGTNAVGSTTANFPTCDMSVRGGIDNPPSRLRRAAVTAAKPTSTVIAVP